MSKISSLASNALLTKSRAMNSYALTSEDYHSLANCRSLNEVAGYLKSNTVYEQAVDVLFGSDIYRSRLEAEIIKFNNTRIAQLASFEKAIGQKLHEIIYLDYDIALILNSANHLDTNEVGDYSRLTPRAYFRFSQLKPDALETATSFEEFYEALSDTQYKKPLDIFVAGKQEFSITALENVLYKYIYGKIKEIVKKNYSGKEQREILELLEAKADFIMLESIYRMKRFFPNEALTLNNISYSGFSAFTLAQIEQMLSAKSTQELLALFKKSRYGSYFDEKLYSQIELCTRHAFQKMNKKSLRFSTVPEVTMFSFIGILENETQNLIHIIEGVRYGIEPEEIMNFVII